MPPPWLAAQAHAMIVRLGEPVAAERLGVGRGAVTRLAARLPVRRGTIECALKTLGVEVPWIWVWVGMSTGSAARAAVLSSEYRGLCERSICRPVPFE